MDVLQVHVGDIIRSARFVNGVRPPTGDEGSVQVGYPANLSDDIAEWRASSFYLVVWAPAQDGTGPSASRMVIACRITPQPIECHEIVLDESICFQTAGESVEKIEFEQIEVEEANVDLSGVEPNVKLIISADCKQEATAIAGSILGFLPTMEAVQGEGGWHIVGFQYLDFQHEKVLAKEDFDVAATVASIVSYWMEKALSPAHAHDVLSVLPIAGNIERI